MAEKTEKNDRSGIQVISRVAIILRALKDSDAGMSLGQIAESVGLPRSTVQRITGALASEGFVMSDPRGRGLRLGPEINSLAEATQLNIVESCRLLLTELTQATGETADLSVLRGSSMIFLDQVPGTHRLRTVSSVGEAFPLTTTANGRACLARLPIAKAKKLIKAEWNRLRTDGDMSEYLSNLETIRDSGLAYDLNEHTTGICAVGFAFRDWSGDFHAISVPVPSTRFEEVRPSVEKALIKTVEHVRTAMGRGEG